MKGNFRRVTVALALVCLADAARAEIAPQALSGETLFVSRPQKKPGVEVRHPSSPAGRVGTPAAMDDVINEVSRRYSMDPGLIATVISVESGFNANAVSPKGARGLMQLMPATARQYGVRNPHDARENIEGGVAYLRDLVQRYKGDLRLALAAYNAGPEAVSKASGIPNYRETRDYIEKIEARYGRVLGPSNGAGFWGATGSGSTVRSIRTTRDTRGNLVATNMGGRRVRVMKRAAPPRPDK